MNGNSSCKDLIGAFHLQPIQYNSKYETTAFFENHSAEEGIQSIL